MHTQARTHAHTRTLSTLIRNHLGLMLASPVYAGGVELVVPPLGGRLLPSEPGPSPV